MNNTIRELMERKSVRAFTDREITEEQREQILLSAMAAPTAGNQQMYTIIDVQKPEIKQQLAELCDHQPFIGRAKLVLIFLADYRKWYDTFIAVGASPRHPEEGDLLLAVNDACIAAQNAVTAARSMGIGSCYIGDVMEQCESMKKLLNLPDYTFPAAMLVFGYPTQQQIERKKPERCALSDIVCIDTYHRKTDDELKKMFAHQTGNQSFEAYIQAFCNRKYNSDFSREMSRSVREYLKDWKESK